jgi:pyridoxamine 5'-phosphate oxidase
MPPVSDRTSSIPADDPLALFGAWMAEAEASEPSDANAMALATAMPGGAPSVRMVLLKDWGANGFTFYTNALSRKGMEIGQNPQAALLFHWKSLGRQVRIEGGLGQVEDAEADAYFASRSRASQLGAHASRQSSPLDERATFLDRFEEVRAKYEGGDVPRPPHWTGFRLTPQFIEFWSDRQGRLHDRRLFSRAPGDAGDGWTSTLLYP